METIRVMHPDVYDTLEFMALAFGGIGSGKDFEDEHWAVHTEWLSENNVECPLCVWGLALFSDADMWNNPVTHELSRVSISRNQNDNAVRRINDKKGIHPRTRVTFAAWRKALKVVRGNAADFPQLASDVRENNLSGVVDSASAL